MEVVGGVKNSQRTKKSVGIFLGPIWRIHWAILGRVGAMLGWPSGMPGLNPKAGATNFSLQSFKGFQPRQT